MRPVVSTVTGVGNGAVIPLDMYRSPAQVSINVQVIGTITYQVQYTFDDPFDPAFNPGTAVWYNQSVLTGSGNTDSNLAYPARAVRLTTSAGTGTARMTVLTAGIT